MLASTALFFLATFSAAIILPDNPNNYGTADADQPATTTTTTAASAPSHVAKMASTDSLMASKALGFIVSAVPESGKSCTSAPIVVVNGRPLQSTLVDGVVTVNFVSSDQILG